MSKYKTRTFEKFELLDRGLPDGNFNDKTNKEEEIYEDSIVGNSRWSIQHELIFQYEDKVYKAYYQVGATENQDEGPWEYQDTIKCIEVEQVEVIKKVWKCILNDQ